MCRYPTSSLRAHRGGAYFRALESARDRNQSSPARTQRSLGSWVALIRRLFGCQSRGGSFTGSEASLAAIHLAGPNANVDTELISRDGTIAPAVVLDLPASLPALAAAMQIIAAVIGRSARSSYSCELVRLRFSPSERASGSEPGYCTRERVALPEAHMRCDSEVRTESASAVAGKRKRALASSHGAATKGRLDPKSPPTNRVVSIPIRFPRAAVPPIFKNFQAQVDTRSASPSPPLHQIHIIAHSSFLPSTLPGGHPNSRTNDPKHSSRHLFS